VVGAEEVLADVGAGTVERVDGVLLADFVLDDFVLTRFVLADFVLVGCVLLVWEMDEADFVLVDFVLLVLETDEEDLEEAVTPRAVVAYHSETGIPKHSPTVTPFSPRF